MAHAAERVARMRLMNKKTDLLCVNETFMDRTIERISLESYARIARRDKTDGRKCGGIDAFDLTNISKRIDSIDSSQDAERFSLLVRAT